MGPNFIPAERGWGKKVREEYDIQDSDDYCGVPIVYFEHRLRSMNLLPKGLHDRWHVERLFTGEYAIGTDFSIVSAKENYHVSLTDRVVGAMRTISADYHAAKKKLLENHIEIQPETDESFEDIIMSCDKLVDVETEVKKSFEKWKAKESAPKRKFGRPDIDIGGEAAPIRYGVLISIISLFALLISAKLGSTPMLIFFTLSLAVSLGTSTAIALLAWEDWEIGWKKGYKIPAKEITEKNKFEFIKGVYVSTIQKINGRLDIAKNKIDSQITLHEQDREQIMQYSDILNNTDEALKKIDQAINDLTASKKKVSSKKGEVNKILEQYVGEYGYIAQKEKELERITIAQELSDRMKKNFKTTLEITKSVDVLTDAIVPGIKKMMEFKIPELIEEIEHKCDVEQSYLEISA